MGTRLQGAGVECGGLTKNDAHSLIYLQAKYTVDELFDEESRGMSLLKEVLSCY